MILKIQNVFKSIIPEIIRLECYQCGLMVHSMIRMVITPVRHTQAQIHLDGQT